MTVSDYLYSKGIEWKRRGDNAIYCCPFCDPPDMEWKGAINLTTGAFNCLHLSRCGSKGSFWNFQERLGDKPVHLADENSFYALTKKKFKKPQVEMSDLSLSVREYLRKRGFSDSTISFFKFKSKGEDVLMIPYFRGKELVNIKYRSIVDKKKMWTEAESEPILFNRDNITQETLRICEGEMDCAALHEYGIEAVSVPMGAKGFQWIEQEWGYLESFPRIDICFDGDVVGRQAAIDLAVRLGEWRCRLVTLPKKDANECLIKGITGDQIDDCFKNAIDIKPETIVSVDHFRNEINELFELGQELFGTKTPWPKLNEIVKGWRPGETTVWSGKSGAGKSTMLNQVFLDLVKKGLNICIFSGEMKPSRFLRWAIIQYCQTGNPTKKQWNDAVTWMTGKVYILNIMNKVESAKMLNDFEYAARRYGVTHFFIDSLMTISFDDARKFQQQVEFVSALSNFAKKFNSHVHLVAHPRKTQYDQDKAGKVDVAGSSDITNLCDNVLILHRSQEDGEKEKKDWRHGVADAILEVNKNREFGDTRSVKLTFDKNTKCFSDEEVSINIFDGKAAAGGSNDD